MHPGRVNDPVLHSLMSQLVAVKAGATFTGFGEAHVPFGRTSFGSFRKAVAEDRIRLVFWAGGLHPYSYPTLMPEMNRVPYRFCTSIFRPDSPMPGIVFPVASELEKESAGSSYWGAVNRHPVAEAVSGTRPLAALLSAFATVVPEPAGVLPETSVEEAVGQATSSLQSGVGSRESGVESGESGAGSRVRSGTRSETPGGFRSCPFTLVGEKRASGIGGFFDDETEVRISPADAKRLGVSDGRFVAIDSAAGRAEFEVRVTPAVSEGVAAVGVNAHRNRALFPLADGDVPAIPPVAVRVSPTDRVVRPVPELAARFS
jgi:formylmethanofuran dehydrogenase subunit D